MHVFLMNVTFEQLFYERMKLVVFIRNRKIIKPTSIDEQIKCCFEVELKRWEAFVEVGLSTNFH